MKARVVAITGFAAFWVGILTAGASYNGYSPTRQAISALAAYGSPVAGLAVASIVVLGLSHYAAAVALARGSQVAAVFVALAGTCLIGVGLIRGGCREATGVCTRADADDIIRRTDAHATMVNYYQLFLVASAVTLLVVAIQSRRFGWAAVCAGLLMASLLLFSGLGPADRAGLTQRLWLADDLLVLVVGMVAVSRRTAARERQVAAV